MCCVVYAGLLELTKLVVDDDVPVEVDDVCSHWHSVGATVSSHSVGAGVASHAHSVGATVSSSHGAGGY